MKTEHKETTLERLEKLVRNQMDFTGFPAKITGHTDLFSDLLMDSLDRLEFAYHVEEDFNVKIPDGAIMGLEKLCDYVKYIDNYKR
jgi:acyl carrier protein